MRATLTVALAAAALAACGDGGPSGSSQTTTTTTAAPASVTLTVASGETGAPVSGATIIVAGVTLTTGGDGTVAAGSVREGATIDVLASGYFDRQTLYRGTDETLLSLWPMTSPTGLTPEITQRLVYTSYGKDAIPGEIHLLRPPLEGPIQVFIDPSIANDDRVVAVVEDSIAALSAALEGSLEVLLVAARPSDGTIWDVVIDPNVAASVFIGRVTLDFDDFEIVGARLAYRTISDLIDYDRVVTYMMGQAFGLHHSNDVNDRMYYDWWSRRPNDFSPKEGLIMRLMLQRRAGQRWPDNDRSLGSRLRDESPGYVRAPR